jgi:hypothetical protein
MEEIEVIAIGEGKRYKLTNITLDEFKNKMERNPKYQYKAYEKNQSTYQNIEVLDYKKILEKRKKSKRSSLR